MNSQVASPPYGNLPKLRPLASGHKLRFERFCMRNLFEGEGQSLSPIKRFLERTVGQFSQPLTGLLEIGDSLDTVREMAFERPAHARKKLMRLGEISALRTCTKRGRAFTFEGV